MSEFGLRLHVEVWRLDLRGRFGVAVRISIGVTRRDDSALGIVWVCGCLDGKPSVVGGPLRIRGGQHVEG